MQTGTSVINCKVALQVPSTIILCPPTMDAYKGPVLLVSYFSSLLPLVTDIGLFLVSISHSLPGGKAPRLPVYWY